MAPPGEAGARPLVAVVIPALTRPGKIGRVLDKLPRDGRFEAIVVDDGSDRRDRRRGPRPRRRRRPPSRRARRRRRGDPRRLACGTRARAPVPRRCSPATTSTSPPSSSPRSTRCSPRDADYVQGSRWLRGRRVAGPPGSRGFGTRLYSAVFSVLGAPPRDRRRPTASGSSGARSCSRPARSTSARPGSTSYDLEPYVLYKAIRRGYKVIEVPCTVRYHAREGYTKMRGLRDWWRLFRPASCCAGGQAMTSGSERSAFAGRRILVTGGAGFVGGALVTRGSPTPARR